MRDCSPEELADRLGIVGDAAFYAGGPLAGEALLDGGMVDNVPPSPPNAILRSS
jgi:hypothetical protein